MKTYAINLIVDTKNTETYDKVAINKFPIIVMCKTEAELKDILTSESTVGFIKTHIKTKKLFDSAQWCIRSVYSDQSVRELVWGVSELTNNIFN